MPYLLVEVSGDPGRVAIVPHDDADPTAVKVLGACANLAAVRLLCVREEVKHALENGRVRFGVPAVPFDPATPWFDPDNEDEPDDVSPSAFVGESPAPRSGNPPLAEPGRGG